MRVLVLAVLFAALALPATARAEVASASPSAFTLTAEADVGVPPAAAWRSLTQIGSWWNAAHSYSGEGRRLRLDAQAGGCFCERWGEGQSVEHARVVMVMEHNGVRTLRMIGALGPLQDMGVTAVWTFVIAPTAGGSKITMTYRVAGEPGVGLNHLAGPVDGVLMEQFGRLVRYTTTGAPT